MPKKSLSLFLSVILFFSLVACNRTTENVSLTGNQLSVEDNKEEVKNYVSNITTEDLIEMRDSNLWLDQKDLDKLSLDGEHYKLPEELLEMLSFSHVKINYPLIVFNTNKVYNLEEKELIFTAEDIILSLEEEWGKTMGVNGVNPYGDTMELEPNFFDFIDNVALSPTKKKVAFSIHLYFIASFTTVAGVFDLETNKIVFVEGPFMDQVEEISWSPDENYFAYITGSANDKYAIYVINSSDLKKVVSVTSTELLDEQPHEHSYTIPRLYEWIDNDSLVIKLKYIGIEENVEKEFIKSIKY